MPVKFFPLIDITVDHFIPWARYPEDGLSNLVLAHERCNRLKRDFLAADGHVEKCLKRNRPGFEDMRQLQAISQQTNRELRRDEIVGVASAAYLGHTAGAELWHEGQQFEAAVQARFQDIFQAAADTLALSTE